MIGPPSRTVVLPVHSLAQTFSYCEKAEIITHPEPTLHIAQSSHIANEIVTTVADYENASPNDLPPLEDKLDPGTYHQFVSVESELTEPLTFEYLFYDVTVMPDGEVNVSP